MLNYWWFFSLGAPFNHLAFVPDFNLEARVKTINSLPPFPASSAVMDEGLKMSAAGHLSLEMLQSSGQGLVYGSAFYLVNPIKRPPLGCCYGEFKG